MVATKTAAKAKKPAAKVAKTPTTESSTDAAWYQRHATDTGSPEFQINLLTTRITALQGHLQANHKDYDAKRTILRLVAERRSHLKFLKANDMEKYLIVNKKTGLKI
jgi:small subunit ribosomal protein S15